VLQAKGTDYSSKEDRLSNFKKLAEDLGVSPMVIWSVYFKKHIDAILSFSKNGQVESEPIRERFVDARNYLDLGLALVEDLKGEQVTRKMAEAHGS
jgi:hypothetical protein